MSNAIEDDYYEEVQKLKKKLAAWEEIGRFIERAHLLDVFAIQRIRREIKKLLHPRRKK